MAIGRIEHNSGCGGFLNPPHHPEHTKSVVGRDFITSLRSAVNDEWLNNATRNEAQRILDAWQPLPLEHEETQDWIHQVLGYFRHCYLPSNGSKNASDLIIDRERDPLEFEDTHRGSDYIREWYPEFVLTAQHLDAAYWGKKPE